MKPSKILALAELYHDEIVQHGADAWKIEEVRYLDLRKNDNDSMAAWRHLAWACGYINELVEAEEYSRAQQWVGFVQGALWCLGAYSIEELREQSVPGGYDPAGGGGGTGRSDFPAGSRGED